MMQPQRAALLRVPLIVTPPKSRLVTVRERRERRRCQLVRRAKRDGTLEMMSPMLLNPYRFGSGASPDTPDIVLGTDLLVWYEKGTGVYNAISGGSLVSGDLEEIGRWEDASGNGYHAVRANGNVAVGHLQWSTATTDRGAGTVHFAADAAAFLTIPDAVGSALSSAAQGQMWVRMSQIGWDGGNGSWDFGTDGSSNHYTWTDGNWYDGFGSNSRKNCGNPGFNSTGVFHVASVAAASGYYGAKINNGADFSYEPGSNTVAFRTSNVHFGCSNSTYAMNDHVSEIVIAKINASSTQCSDMQTYLST